MLFEQVDNSLYCICDAVAVYEQELGKGLQVAAGKEVRFVVFDKILNKEVGHFYFSAMPGCCGVIVSHFSHYDGHKGAKFHSLKEHVAKTLGYGLMIATAITANFPETIGAAKSGWRLGPVFHNLNRTGNQVVLMYKILIPYGQREYHVPK